LDKIKVAYFDNFTGNNSNGYWFKAFETLGEVTKFDVIPINRNRTWASVPKRVRDFEPTHIHCGGSIKHGSIVPVGFIRWIREAFPGVRITYFFGDAYNKMPYYTMLEPYIDNVFMSNSKWCRTDKYVYMPCPAPKENVRKWTDRKKYDVVFIGNNYNADRLKTIRDLAKKFNVTVFGERWPTDLNCPGSVSFAQYSDICSQAKVVVGDPAGPICSRSTGSECLEGDPDKLWTKGLCRAYNCRAYEELSGYLSNRLANTLIAGTAHVVPYVEGIEEAFSEDELIWYRDKRERDEIIGELLSNPARCKEVALAGQRKILKELTYDKCVRRITAGSGLLMRKITIGDAKAFSMMRNAEDTFRWFFSGKRFTSREVMKWIKTLPATDEIYMVEYEGELIGTCSIYNVDWEKKTAEIGRIVVQGDRRGKGLGTKILNEVVHMCTMKGLKMIYANIKQDNISSQKAFTKAGFQPATEPTFYWRAL
jgi:RimJ/RimL family protein N-acetyltransferase